VPKIEQLGTIFASDYPWFKSPPAWEKQIKKPAQAA
jgi:hypothetical protein